MSFKVLRIRARNVLLAAAWRASTWCSAKQMTRIEQPSRRLCRNNIQDVDCHRQTIRFVFSAATEWLTSMSGKGLTVYRIASVSALTAVAAMQWSKGEDLI
jgi:hypothetical protein